jgi:outer membrane protein TolC
MMSGDGRADGKILTMIVLFFRLYRIKESILLFFEEHNVASHKNSPCWTGVQLIVSLKNISLITFLFLLIASSTGFAETLEDAWQITLSVDNRVQASRKTTESFEQTLSAAKAARLPSLGLGSGYTILNHSPAARIIGSAFPIKEIPTAEDKSFSFNTTATFPLYTSGLISNGIDAARADLNASAHDEAKTVLDVKLNVAQAYVDVLRSKRLVDVAESNVASLSAHGKDVANFYEQGIVTKNDLLASQVSLADARQRLIQALNNLDLARAAYNRLLARPLGQEVKIDDISAHPIKRDLPELTSDALKKRPELATLSEQARALEYQAAGTRSSVYPQIELSGGYNYQQNKYLVFQSLWSATMGLKWDIFDGGVARHNANALLQKAEALVNLRADAASVITLQVRQAWLDLDETLKRIQVTHDALAQAEENLRVTNDRYREGVGTNTEVLDAETLRTRSHSNYYNAVYDAVLARIRLQYATGEL